MRILLTLLICLPAFAFAASDGAAPKPTNTTKSCKGVKVWDAKKNRCVKPKGASLDTETLYQAVRELAYAGRYSDAQGVLRAMPDQNDDRVLTYWGFTHRKMGNPTEAQVFYSKAIQRNPDNIIARSYMGQGFVDDGRMDDAIDQWREIRTRGGQGSWPEVSLAEAIRSGTTYSY